MFRIKKIKKSKRPFEFFIEKSLSKSLLRKVKGGDDDLKDPPTPPPPPPTGKG